MEVLSRTDPFVLRHRAISSHLASPFALAIAIRHLVLRRGYDFHASSEGEFPWGEDPSLAEARKWLETSHINGEIADYLCNLEPELTTKASASGKELTGAALAKEEAEREAFHQDVHKRLRECEKLDIGSQLESYRRSNDPRLRTAMRRRNLPRRLLEEHLRNIITRHAHLIPNVDEFTAALFLKPDHNATPLLQRRAKEKAIFHFNRKTQAEAQAIWLRKTKECSLASRLGLPAGKAGDAKDEDIRRWRILEFAATRRIEITTTGKGVAKAERVSTVRLPASVVEALVASVANKATKWSEVKKLISDGIAVAHPGAKPVPATRSPFNNSYFTQLRDLALPTAANGRKKASVSPVTAAHLVQVAILMTKVANQHSLLRSLDPFLAPMPKLQATSFSRILRAEARYARTFWSRYFAAASSDLFTREKRKATHPLNAALNYGYGFLYHAIEWQCIASGLEPSIGLIHKNRKNRPSLVCDLIEPFRCCVEITLMRHLDQMHEKKDMAVRYAEMMEELWTYRGHRFRLRSIIRLSVESFVNALLKPTSSFKPFSLHARDACL